MQFSLPDHLTCEVHTFISEDKKHDDGLACYALETLAEKFVAATQLPSAITFWSDGSIFSCHILCH